MGSWSTVGDPSVYGQLEVDTTQMQNFLHKINKNSDLKIGINEVIGKITAMTLKKRPEMNGMIRFGRIYLRDSVNLFYQVNVVGGADDPIGKANLLGLTIENAEKKSLNEIAKELKDKSKKIKSGHENQMTKSVKTLSFVPWQFMKCVLNAISFLNYDLNLPLEKLGLPKDPFGSVMITNVGSLGIETAWAPLVPYTRVPLLLTVGAIKMRPWVVGDKIEARPILKIGCTFDHRFMDGVHAADMTKTFFDYFENPEKLLL